MLRRLKGGALYVSVIISILISIILSLFIVLAYYNTRSVQAQSSVVQLRLGLESGFGIARSAYYTDATGGSWQKMPYNNDSIQVRKKAWGCYLLIDVKAKNAHFSLNRTGLFGTTAWRDTALVLAEQNRQIGLAGKIRFRGNCYFPKAGIKTAYIEGTGFSDLGALKPYIFPAPTTIPELDEYYLETIARSQSGLDPYSDSLLSFMPERWSQSFKQQTAVVQQGSMKLDRLSLSDNIKLIASDVITVESSAQLTNVLLIARKVVFKKGFKGTVHAICRDSIVAEDGCEFAYPSSFCVYAEQVPDSAKGKVRGIFFGTDCKFKGGLLAANDPKGKSRMMIRLNTHFELIGSIYSSDYADAQGNLYGSLCCRTLLLQTSSGVYENHLYNCFVDPKRYSTNLSVPAWHKQKDFHLTCARWF